jgi:hypothetical protein
MLRISCEDPSNATADVINIAIVMIPPPITEINVSILAVDKLSMDQRFFTEAA